MKIKLSSFRSVLALSVLFLAQSLLARPSIPPHCQGSPSLICSGDFCTCLDSPQGASECVGNLCVIYRLEVQGCTKKVSVDRMMYTTYKAFMASLLDENGVPVPVLTPSQQTMMLFYTTLIENAAKTSCESNASAGGR